jgi:hypothetical protein
MIGRQLPTAHDGVQPFHVRKLDVEQNEVPHPDPQPLEERGRRGDDVGVVLVSVESLAQDEGEVLVVLRDQNPIGHR